MKQCTVCQKELPTGINEFGNYHVPLCESCFYEFGSAIEDLLLDHCEYFHIPAVVRFCRKYEYDLDDLLTELEMEEIDIDFVLEGGAR